jgi:hypothetical protein
MKIPSGMSRQDSCSALRKCSMPYAASDSNVMNELPPAIRVLVLVLMDLPGRLFWFICLSFALNEAVRRITDSSPVTQDSVLALASSLAIATAGLLMVTFAALLRRRSSDSSPPLRTACLSALYLIVPTAALLVAVFFLGTFYSITKGYRDWSAIFGALLLITAFGYWFFHRTKSRLERE